jgi:diguanylate cyclase (GGDEF)-like protein
MALHGDHDGGAVARPDFPVRRSQRLAWLIAGPLFVVALGIGIPVAINGSQVNRNIAYVPLFAAMFAVSRINFLQFGIRRQVIYISLVDLPLILALWYLSPGGVLIAGAVGFAASLVINRIPPTKFAFNLASYTAGVAIANLIVAAWGLNGAGPRTWVVLAGAVYGQTQTMLLSIIGVIAIVEGPSQVRQLRRSAVFGIVVTAINVVVGLIVLLALRTNGWAILLIIGLAVLLGVGYRAYAQFVRQHESLAELYDLTQVLAESDLDGTLFDVLLSRTRGLMQAESATLWMPAQGRHPEVLLSARADYPGLLDRATTPDMFRQRVIGTGDTVFVNAKTGAADLRAELAKEQTKDVIVVALRSGSVVTGTLEVAGRLGDQTSFRTDDVRLMETLAAHAAVAVENSRLVDRLRFDASHDLLTGLPNRIRLLEALDAAVSVPAIEDVVAVMVLDVVDLRQVNESLGQKAGDEVLVEVARRLQTISPAGAMLARAGGDEFVLEIRVAGVDAAVSLAEHIRDGLRERMKLGSLYVDIDTSVGVAVYPDHGGDAEALLRRAEVAAHAAKRRSAIQLFDPGLETRSVRRLGLASDLQPALSAGNIEVYFQPKVAISDRRLVGVECLARWDHPVHGSVDPRDVVAVAEHTGELARLTEFVLREGLRRAKGWAESGRDLPVAVNIAVRTLLDAGFPGLVQRLLDEYGVAADRLILEFTEEAMAADTERPAPTLHRLHDIGVRLSVDDFGTGSSSLSRIGRLPVDEVKVDRTFVQGMTTDPKDLAIVRSVVDMSRHFGLVCVAEGVESELTLGVLSDIGCDVGQGFLFSRPLPYERLDAWLRGQNEADSVPAGEGRWLRAVP